MNQSNRIFIHKILKAIADSIISVFIPLYILKTTNKIELAIAYLIFYSLFVMINMFVLKKVLLHHKLFSIYIHCIPIIIAQALLSFCNITFLICVLTAYLMSLAQSLYYIPLNIIFASTDKKVNVTKFEISSNIGKLIFMFISALILSKIPNSFVILSTISSVFYILCLIPLFNKSLFETKTLKVKHPETNKPKISIWFHIYHLSFGAFQVTIDNIIPLYLYTINASFEAVTIIIVAVELLKFCSSFLAKFFIQKKLYLTSCTISSILFLASVILFIFIKNSIILYILTCIISVSFPLSFNPMFALFCKKTAYNNQIENDMFTRDLYIFASRPLYFASYFVCGSLIVCMAIGIASVVSLYISQIKSIKSINMP